MTNTTSRFIVTLQVGIDARPARPATNPLSIEKIRLVQQEQSQLLDNAREVWKSMVDHPYESLSQQALLPQVKTMSERARIVRDMLGPSIPTVTDSFGAQWHIDLVDKHDTLTVNGKDPNKWGPMMIELCTDPEWSHPVSVTDVLIYQGYDPIVEVNTRDAITIANTFFDAIVKPYEKALGIL